MAYIEDTNLVEEIKSLRISVGGKDVFPDEAKESVLRIISEQPTADVVEVKHGYWKDRYGNKYINHLYECSVCSKEALFESYKNELDQWKERQALTPVCPHCGAEMDGERKHSN